MNPSYTQAELERLNAYDPNTNPFVHSARQQLRQLPTIPSNGPQFGYPTQQANRVPTILSPSQQQSHYVQPNLYPSVPNGGPQFAGYPSMNNSMNSYPSNANNAMNSSMSGMNSMNSMGGMNSMNSMNNPMNNSMGGMNSMNSMNHPTNNSMNSSLSGMPSQPPSYQTGNAQYTQQQLQQQAHILQQLQNQQNQQMLALQQQQEEIERKRLDEQAKLKQAQELERKRLEEQQRILQLQELERKKAEEQKRVQQELEKKRIEEQKRLQLQEQERKKAEEQRKLLERQEMERKRIEEQKRLQQEQERKKAEETKRLQQERERIRLEEQKRVQLQQAQEQERKRLEEQQKEQERKRVEAQQQKLLAEKKKAEQEEAFAREVERRRLDEEKRAFLLEQERLLAYQQEQHQLRAKQLLDAHLSPPVQQIDPTNPPIKVDQAWREAGYDTGAASLTIYVGEASHLSENTWLPTYPYFVIERNMANIERVFKCPASEGVNVNFSMKCTIRIDDPYSQGFQIRIMHERPKGLPNLCLGLKRFPSFAYFSSSYNAATANPVHKLISDDQILTGGALTLYFQYTNNRASEITGPTNFHYGFGISVNKDGQIVTRNLPKEWKQIFKAAGVTPKMFRDPESLKVILQEVNGSLAQVAEAESAPNTNSLADSKDLSSYDGNVAENVDCEMQQKALEEQQREAAREQAELEERMRRDEEAKAAARERRLAEKAREEEERREREEARARLLSLGQEKGSLTHIEEVVQIAETLRPVEQPNASNNVSRLPESSDANKTQQPATTRQIEELEVIEELVVIEEVVELVVEVQKSESRRAVPVPEPEPAASLPEALPSPTNESHGLDALPPVQSLAASSEMAPRFPSGLPTDLPAFLSPEDLARAANDLPTALPPAQTGAEVLPRFPSGLPTDLPDFSSFVGSDGAEDLPTTLPKMQTGSYEYYPEPQPELASVLDAEPMKRGFSKAPPKLRAIPQEATNSASSTTTNNTNANTNVQPEPRASPLDGGITADAILRSKSCLKPVALTLPSIKQLNQQQAGNLASVLSSALAQRRVAMLQSDGAKEQDDDDWSDDSRDD